MYTHGRQGDASEYNSIPFMIVQFQKLNNNNNIYILKDCLLPQSLSAVEDIQDYSKTGWMWN